MLLMSCYVAHVMLCYVMFLMFCYVMLRHVVLHMLCRLAYATLLCYFMLCCYYMPHVMFLMLCHVASVWSMLPLHHGVGLHSHM